MQLQKQCANKELSQKLWELGVRVDSLFWWVNIRKKEYTPSYEVFYYDEEHSNFNKEDKIPALTSSELGEMLPEKYKSFKYDGEWLCEYEDDKGYLKVSSDKYNEANNRAKMLIHLLEQGLVKVEDINKQLN